jgi:hypothetical protein
MTKGILISPDGSFEDVDFESLEDLQQVVGGYINIFHLSLRDKKWPFIQGANMAVDEDGYAKQLPLNVTASRLSDIGGHPEMIVGKVVITGIFDKAGQFTNVNDELSELIDALSTEEQEIENASDA